MPKAYIAVAGRDKHNCLQRDWNMDPLTLQPCLSPVDHCLELDSRQT